MVTHTITINRESRAFRELLRVVPEYEKPRTRAECENGPRPCPFISCRQNLSADIISVVDYRRAEMTENIRLLHPGKDDPTDIEPPTGNNCALDYANRGGMSFDEIAEVFDFSRQRVQQIEQGALRKLRKHSPELLAQMLEGANFTPDPESVIGTAGGHSDT